MIGEISNRYIKAILASFDSKDLSGLLDTFYNVNLAFSDEKFNEILNSALISDEKKAEFIITLMKNPSKKCVNLVKILAKNHRLQMIPTLIKTLNYENSKAKNEFRGVIYSKFHITSTQIKALEANFSKKFGVKIILETIQSDFNGLKINIENLGVEINFSVDRLKNLLSQHILKAI